MKPAAVASATVGYLSAVARASTSSSASAWRSAGFSGLSGTSSACSSALRRRPMAPDVVDVVAAVVGTVVDRMPTACGVECDDEEHAAPSISAATETDNPNRQGPIRNEPNAES